MPVTDDDGLRELLSMDPVAVVGCSSTPGKAAHDIPEYLQEHGYEVIPVNPYADEILGREAYDALADVEEEIGLVDVFRPSEEVAGIVDDVLARREDRGDVAGLWLQLGITDDEALARAEDAGLLTTQDTCMKVEHGRLVG
ncbi:CoA-binding protein [Halobaculum sp. CBA1158]|uniref:CoA-binding protein n=1 Tax=Halobaculum sp. CBA1158 TaxID=2904243 RepID=UPI001F22B8CF|nr:CoA-binding protein [Halobaculum sp. CBA1158]UIO99168.1 CoA-binding protein [Halobaculum sp. CBA1158]